MWVLTIHSAIIIRGKYLPLFPEPVQGKVFNFEAFGEEFWGLIEETKKNFDFQQFFGQRLEKKI